MKRLLCVLAFGILQPFSGAAQQGWKIRPVEISTRWAKQVSPSNVLPEYPRPQLVRPSWTNLNGLWQYAITPVKASVPAEWNEQILVPFPVESALSGVQKRLGQDQLLWYKRHVSVPAARMQQRSLLHFGAVDYEATVYINGRLVGQHTGGYQAFTVDITDALKAGDNELVVRVWDPTDKGPNPHGKQVMDPHGIMYTPSSGIWQTVWLETVPAQYISRIHPTPDIDQQLLNLVVSVAGNCEPCSVEAIALSGKQIAGRVKGAPGQSLQLPIPGARLWSPDDPFLYDLEVTVSKQGKVIDRVRSYAGMRKVSVQADATGRHRIFLNNRYTYNLGTLDQGFWPDGLYTAPTDAALRFDIEAAKAMGFNTIRKHIKIEPARWYYHADKLGMLVWQDMVNPGNETPEGKQQFEKEIRENLEQLHPHPSITTWVLFNEKWGQYDQERLTKWMKTADPSRLVNGHSGEVLYVNDQLRSPSPDAWIGADMTDVHAYPNPGHIVLEKGKAATLGEFGGIGVPVEYHLWDDLVAGWGYDGIVTPARLQQQYTYMVDSLKVLEQQGLTASIYTQPFDVESEQNGLITYDRAIIKLPIHMIRAIHARLWPATKNLATATKGFSAVVADTVSQPFTARWREYQMGKRDPRFLRSLALLALRQKDTARAKQVAHEFILLMKDQPSEANAKFIMVFTGSTQDTGFAILRSYLKGNLGSSAFLPANKGMQDIIFRESVRPLLTGTPDWQKVDDIIKSYPELDGELILGLSVIRYLNANAERQPNSAKNLSTAATRYEDRIGKGAYNDWAWSLFQSTGDTGILNKALVWSEKAIAGETEKHRIASTMDTKANILYRLGRKQEALTCQEKALSYDPGNYELVQAFEKMKKGEPTWPL